MFAQNYRPRRFRGFGGFGQIDLPTGIPTGEPLTDYPLGSLINPIKINKPTTKIGYGYIPEISPNNGRGAVVVPAGQKLYFEVDPLAITGGSVSAFGVAVKFPSGIGVICKLTQDKATGAYSPEDRRGYTGFMDITYDNLPYEIDNTRFLYAIDNSEGGSPVSDEIWATINPEAIAPAELYIPPEFVGVTIAEQYLHPELYPFAEEEYIPPEEYIEPTEAPYIAPEVLLPSYIPPGEYILPEEYIEPTEAPYIPPEGYAEPVIPPGAYQPQPLTTPITIAGFDLGSNWPILAIVGIGAFMMFKGKPKGGSKHRKKKSRRR